MFQFTTETLRPTLRSDADNETCCDVVAAGALGALFEETVLELPTDEDELLDDDEEARLVVLLDEKLEDGELLKLSTSRSRLSSGEVRGKLTRLLPDDAEDCAALVRVGADTEDGVDLVVLELPGGEKVNAPGLGVVAFSCVANRLDDAR